MLHNTDVVVVGGGLGGVAAALALLRAGRRVVLTEEFEWLGGQLTSQAVPPDEHSWVERFGVTASYRALREGIRDYYRRHYPLTARARAWRELNPGAGNVSRLCHEPRVAVAVIDEMLAPYRGSGRLTILQPARPISARSDGDRIVSVTVEHNGEQVELAAPYILDATETGELLPLSGTEYVTGFESTLDTGEPSAPEVAQPANMQAMSVCFAIDHVDGDHTIDRPARYDFWRNYQPEYWGDRMLSFRSPDPRTLNTAERTFTPNPDDDPLSVVSDQRVSAGDGNLWTFRRIAARRNFVEGAYDSDICLVNWPMIDYFESPVIDVPDAARHIAAARELSRSVLYWLQTEAPRADGGTGFPACACAATSPAARTAWPRHRTSASPAGSGPSTRSSSRTSRSPCAATRAPCSTPTPWVSACTASTCTPRPAATTTSTSRAARSRSRSARSSPSGWRTSCPRARTSAPPTSPTVPTGCTRSSGTSARSRARSRTSAWRTESPSRGARHPRPARGLPAPAGTRRGRAPLAGRVRLLMGDNDV